MFRWKMLEGLPVIALFFGSHAVGCGADHNDLGRRIGR